MKPGEGGTVTIDDYVRFAFESPAGTAGTGTVAIADGPGTLVEIAVDLATGRLRGATLVTYGRRSAAIHFDVAALPVEHGLPVLSLPAFAADDLMPRLAVAGAVQLWRRPGVALVQVAAGEPDRAIRASDALVLAAGDTLWGFGADGLDDRTLSLMAG